MNTVYWIVILPILFGTMQGVGVWVCLWYQRIGWTITLTANLAWIMFGHATGLWGLSIGMVLASTAQVHHLWATRREPFTGRRVPVTRPSGTSPAAAKRTRRRIFRHEQPLRYTPGRAVAPVVEAPPRTAILPAAVEPEPTTIRPLVGINCPCGCGRFAPSDFVAHLERNRGSISHWAVTNRDR